MAQPGLELEQRHRLFCIEQLRRDRGSSPVARDVASGISERNACLAAQERDQRSVEILRWDGLTAETEQHRNGLTGLTIEEMRLNRSMLLPRADCLADERIDRFREGGPRFIRRHVE